jgi:hypothetical protein
MDKYKVYTWSGSGYFTNEYIVESESEDEAFWEGVDLAIKDNGIYYISITNAYDDFEALSDEDKEGYDDYFDYYMLYMGYSYHCNDIDFEGFVLLENARVEKVEDDDIEK